MDYLYHYLFESSTKKYAFRRKDCVPAAGLATIPGETLVHSGVPLAPTCVVGR